MTIFKKAPRTVAAALAPFRAALDDLRHVITTQASIQETAEAEIAKQRDIAAGAIREQDSANTILARLVDLLEPNSSGQAPETEPVA